ncbi:NADH dehydrogenase ubiquinone Fe-S protein 4 [Cribrihabitans pelagius]|uniref:NADH dehydrogenase ubiquinone Fe-S protein 4 n=1 Tax=Cribrihabitans pelagius TaxID=1765746 RepID=UPI003B5A5AE0
MDMKLGDIQRGSPQTCVSEEKQDRNSGEHMKYPTAGSDTSLLPKSSDFAAPIAFVYRPARNPMQSAPRSRNWLLQLEPQRPLELEPLMGWTSCSDPARQIRLTFPTREAAFRFGKEQGWRVYALPENERKPARKSCREQIETWQVT